MHKHVTAVVQQSTLWMFIFIHVDVYFYPRGNNNPTEFRSYIFSSELARISSIQSTAVPTAPGAAAQPGEVGECPDKPSTAPPCRDGAHHRAWLSLGNGHHQHQPERPAQRTQQLPLDMTELVRATGTGALLCTTAGEMPLYGKWWVMHFSSIRMIA